MKSFFKNPLTHCSVIFAAALLAGIAKVQEDHKETSVSRAIIMTEHPRETADPTRMLTVMQEHSVTGSPQNVTLEENSLSSRTASNELSVGLLNAGSTNTSPEEARALIGRHKSLSNYRRTLSHNPSDDSAMTTAQASENFENTTAPVILEEAREPVAHAIPHLDTTKFTPREIDAIREEQNRFQEAINSAPDQNPDSPAYFDHWKTAQRLHDEQLRITLGWDRFNLLSAQAAANHTEVP